MTYDHTDALRSPMLTVPIAPPVVIVLKSTPDADKIAAALTGRSNA